MPQFNTFVTPPYGSEIPFNPDATSIYDIRSTPYDVDRVDPFDAVLHVPLVCDEDRLDPDATSIIDIRGTGFDVDDLDTTAICIRTLSRDVTPYQRSTSRRCRLIRAARQDIAGLREALASGWDIGPELAFEERRLAALEEE
jgi:hypothetical protein